VSVVEASSGTYRSRVDGTLVLQVEIEPRHAQAALALFGMPGTSLAIARLKTPAEVEKQPEKPLKEGPRRSTGTICHWLAMRCKDRGFQGWAFGKGAASNFEDDVAEWCRLQCNVNSRSEIDGNADAEARFESLIRKPWAEHQRKAGIAEHASR
jgi:hypothetical protein